MLLLKNVDSSSNLVNGATGEVTEFVEASGRKLPKVLCRASILYFGAVYVSSCGFDLGFGFDFHHDLLLLLCTISPSLLLSSKTQEAE